MFFFFFFQAEDGIRDFHVTGVQTCALPICRDLRAQLSSAPSPITFFARLTYIFLADLRAQSCSLFFLTSARFFNRRQTQFFPARFISLLALDAPPAN